MVVSCGNGSDDDKTKPVTNSPDDRENEEDENPGIRYSSIVLEENCGFWTDCDFTVRTDFNQRPIVINASFVDNGWPVPETENDSIDEGKCDFRVTLNEEEGARLKALADKLRFCETENVPTADGGFHGLFATDTSGTESMVYKYKNRGQEEEGKIKYICGGRAGYYNEMKKIILPKAPVECPSGYKRLFK
jgi:hypothetical protein